MGVTGRPTKYRESLIDEGYQYLNGGYEDVGDVIPSIVGLARKFNVAETTLQDWAEKYDGFYLMIRQLIAEQQRVLLNGGMKGKLNPTITKLVLAKHGYHEKTEVIDTFKRSDTEHTDQQTTFVGVKADNDKRVSSNPRVGFAGQGSITQKRLNEDRKKADRETIDVKPERVSYLARRRAARQNV